MEKRIKTISTTEYLSADIEEAHQNAGKLIQALQTECWRQYEKYCDEDYKQRERLGAGKITSDSFKCWRSGALEQFKAFYKRIKRAEG